MGTYPPGGFAPLFLYNLTTDGAATPLTAPAILAQLQRSGVAPHQAYPYPADETDHQPTAAQRHAALPYRIARYTALPARLRDGAAQRWITATLAAGRPLAVVLPWKPAFDHPAAPGYLLSDDHAPATYNHALFAPAFDVRGLWIENSCGPRWGYHGYAEVPWSYVDVALLAAYTSTPLP